jgi:hypothetical protein
LIGIPINDFAELALTSMQEISDELGFWICFKTNLRRVSRY